MGVWLSYLRARCNQDQVWSEEHRQWRGDSTLETTEAAKTCNSVLMFLLLLEFSNVDLTTKQKSAVSCIPVLIRYFVLSVLHTRPDRTRHSGENRKVLSHREKSLTISCCLLFLCIRSEKTEGRGGSNDTTFWGGRGREKHFRLWRFSAAPLRPSGKGKLEVKAVTRWEVFGYASEERSWVGSLLCNSKYSYGS